jgi:hypothetical protein
MTCKNWTREYYTSESAKNPTKQVSVRTMFHQSHALPPRCSWSVDMLSRERMTRSTLPRLKRSATMTWTCYQDW